MTGMQYQKLSYPLKVMDYQELYLAAKALVPEIDTQISAITAAGLKADTDRREISLKIVEHLSTLVNLNTPTVVIFLAPPYCPRNTLKREVPEEREILNSVASLLRELGLELGESLQLMQFFPVLTDSSYLKVDDTDASVQTLISNFPDMKGIYNVPMEQIKRLNIPAFNFGCHGKDAHKWTERVHKEYTFGKLPLIMLRALEKYLVT